jgi:MFS transporter, ACS family, hexuronate transporter
MRIPRTAWVIAVMLCLATMLNYGDRLTLSVVSVDVRREFSLSEQDYSHVVTLFLAAYAIMYAGSGLLVDRLGTRRGFALFVGAWSAAQMLHAAVVGKWSLGASRFLLGLAEPGNWPAAAKAVAEWFPASHRALGVGIFNSGSSLGSALAPPVVAQLTLWFGWRAAFLFTGALGAIWLIGWLVLYQPPHLSRWLNKRDYAELKDHVRPPEETLPAKISTRESWAVLRRRECWTLILARFFTDPVIYFIIFWLPEYLRKERGFDLAMVGKYAWVPFIFGDIGYVFGGWLSGRLMQAGWRLDRSRKAVMLLGALVMPAAIVAPLVPTAGLAIAATCVVTFGHALWVSNLQTLPTDLFRGSQVGAATGFSGMGGAVGGMLANLGTGYLVTHFSYAPVFLMAGLVHPLSIVLIYWLMPRRYFDRVN